MIARQDNIKLRVTVLRFVADDTVSTIRVPFRTQLSLSGQIDSPDEQTISLVIRCAD